MNLTIKQVLCGIFITMLGAGPVHATVIDRGNGLIYDDVLDITWLQGAGGGGTQSWFDAVNWADTLMFGGFDDWRLPSMSVAALDPMTGTGTSASVVNCETATEMDCRDNELGYLYYYNLPSSEAGLLQSVQFFHWSGTEFDPFSAWDFDLSVGDQLAVPKEISFGVATWAVRPGDSLAAVPEPSTLFLLGTGLLGIVGYTRGNGR